LHEHVHVFSPLPDSLERAHAAARRAVEAAPSSNVAHNSLAAVLFFQKDFLGFRRAAERCMELNPMDASSTAFMGILLAYSGEWERGCAIVERASQMNPHHPGWYHFALFLNAYRKGDYPAALKIAAKIDLPRYHTSFAARAAVLGQLGEIERARNELSQILALRPDYASSVRRDFSMWYPPDLVEHWIEGLRKAGLDVPEAQTSAAMERPPSPAGSREATDSGASRAEEGFWVAALPFQYTGRNEDLKELAKGLWDEVITGLSRFSYLRVIARGSTAKYASESGDVRAIGKELGARYVMEGSIRQAGTTARVAVQLVDATTGTHLWAETFERGFRPEQAFELQDELVPRIVSTVADQHGILVRSIAAAIRKKGDAQLSPYEAVFRVFSLHEQMTAQGHAACRDLLERVVKEAPDEGDCWAMLATLYSDEDWFGFNLRPDPLGRALAAAQRAVEFAPASALASQAMAQSLFMRRE